MAPPYQGYSNQITQRGTPSDGGESAQQRWDGFQTLYRTNKAQRDEKEAAQYSLAAGDGTYFNPNGIPGINAMRNSSPGGGIFGTPSFDRRMLEQQNGYGDLFGGIANFGSGALDKISEWSGKQGVNEWAKIGLGIKDQFFDRPKMINSYLDQGSSLNELRGVQMNAINANIAGAYKNQQDQDRRTARFDESQALPV
tara:strand:+ start:1014 stop:1604 length:591 start_codon:yes stop_codon:yes gene_type:complete